MGLSSIPPSEWIKYDHDYSKRIYEKKYLINEQRDRVIQSIKGSEAAQHELLNEIILFIEKYQSDLFSVNANLISSYQDRQIYNLSEYKSTPLELISYLAIDDFCLLEEYNDDYRLVAASVCSPTYWELSEKIGRPMREVHAPIVSLEEKIGRMIRYFFTNLKSDDYFQRSNWFLMTTPDMSLFKDRYEMDININNFNIHNIMNKLYLRCERQSFRKLKQSKNIAFGIRIYVAPLSIVEKYTEIAEDLIMSINTMTADQRELFGVGSYEKILVSYLETVLQP